MSGFHCPHCGKITNLFGKGGGKTASKELNLYFLGTLPFDPRVMALSDQGKPFIITEFKTPIAKAFQNAIDRLLQRLKGEH